MLFPVSEGQTIVRAAFDGHFAEAVVTVNSRYAFNLELQSTRMFPGQILDVPFQVRPVDTNIFWVSSCEFSGTPVVMYEVIGIDNILRITALGEGTSTITGAAHGRTARLNIRVAYDFRLRMDRDINFTPTAYHNENPTEIRYRVYPPNTRIFPYFGNMDERLRNQITIEITDPVRNVETGEGEGSIWISSRNELDREVIVWKQLRAGGIQTRPEDLTGEEVATQLLVVFSPRENPVPFFLRTHGVWSNRNRQNDNTGRFAINRSPFSSETPGRIMPFNAESIERVSQNNVAAREFNLVIGDGENHYILFDRLYHNSLFQLQEVGNLPYQLAGLIEFEVVDIDFQGTLQQALRISGGRDHIIYDRVAFNRRLEVVATSTQVDDPNWNYPDFEERPLWSQTVNFNYQDGYNSELRNLWVDQSHPIRHGQDPWTIFTDAERTLLINYQLANAGNFQSRASVVSLEVLGTMNPQHIWASRLPPITHTFGNSNDGSGELRTLGIAMNGQFLSQAYGYTLVTINNPDFASVFSGVQWITDIHTTGLPSGQQFTTRAISAFVLVPRLYTIPVYLYHLDVRNQFISDDDEDSFVELRDLVEEIFEHPEHIAHANPIFSLHPSNLQRILSQLNQIPPNFVASLERETYIIEVYSPLPPGGLQTYESVWHVFGAAEGRAAWSGSFGIVTGPNAIGYQSIRPCGNSGGGVGSLYFEYFGLRRSRPTTNRVEIVVTDYEYRDIGDGESGSNWVRIPIAWERRNEREIVSNTFVNEIHFWGRRIGGHNPFDGLVGNHVSLNIFGNRRYLTQQMMGRHRGGIVNAATGNGSCRRWGRSCWSRMYNSTTYVRQTYRWRDTGNTYIVPISRMTQFPFHIYRGPQQPQQPFTRTNQTEWNLNSVRDFRYADPSHYRNRFIIDYRNPRLSSLNDNPDARPGEEVNSAPMPTTNTNLLPGSRRTDRVEVSYKLFGDRQFHRYFVFNITFEQRASHHLFRGFPTGQSDGREVNPPHSGVQEFPYIHTWDDLRNVDRTSVINTLQRSTGDDRNLFRAFNNSQFIGSRRDLYFSYISDDATWEAVNNTNARDGGIWRYPLVSR